MNPATIFVVVLFGVVVGNVSAKDYEVTYSIPKFIGQFSITHIVFSSDDGAEELSRVGNFLLLTTHVSNDHTNQITMNFWVEVAEFENEDKVAIADVNDNEDRIRFTANIPSSFSSESSVVIRNYWHFLHKDEEKGPSETEGTSVATLRLAPPQGINLEFDMHTIKDTSCIVNQLGTTIGEVTLTISDVTTITATAKTIEHLLGDDTLAADVDKLTITAEHIMHVEQSPLMRNATKNTIQVTEWSTSRDQLQDPINYEMQTYTYQVKYKINLLRRTSDYFPSDYFSSDYSDQIEKTLLKDYYFIKNAVVSMWQPSMWQPWLEIKVPGEVKTFEIESRLRSLYICVECMDGEDDFILDTTVSREGDGWTVTSTMDLRVRASIKEKINCNQKRRLDEDDVYDCLGESGRNSAGSGPSKVSIVLMSVLIPLGLIGIVIVACYYRRRQKPEATELELGPDIELPTKMQGIGYARDLRICGVEDDQA